MDEKEVVPVEAEVVSEIPEAVNLIPAEMEIPTDGGPVLVEEVPATDDTPITASAEVNTVEDTARLLAKQLMEDTTMVFSPSDLEVAIKSATLEDVTDYTTWVKHVQKVVKEEVRREKEQEDLKEAAKQSLARWEKSIVQQYGDVQVYAQKLLEQTYNLPEGMLSAFDVQLNLMRLHGVRNTSASLFDEIGGASYSNPAFAIVRNIGSEAVKSAVDYSIDAMEQEDFTALIEDLIQTSGLASGDSMEAKRKYLLQMADNLPQLVGKNAPDNYKIWYVLTRGANGSSTAASMTDSIYAFEDTALQHQAFTENLMHSGIPQATATDVAYKNVVAQMDPSDTRTKSWTDNVGHIIGTIIAQPARCSMAINEAMYEAMGPYGETWRANQEKSKEYRRNMKTMKMVHKHEKEMQRMQSQQNTAAPNRVGYQQGAGFVNRHNVTGTVGNLNNGVDLKVPPVVVIVIVHILLGVICWFAMSNIWGIIAIAGLLFGLYGIVTFKTKGAEAILTAAIGYIVVVLAVIFRIVTG